MEYKSDKENENKHLMSSILHMFFVISYFKLDGYHVVFV